MKIAVLINVDVVPILLPIYLLMPILPQILIFVLKNSPILHTNTTFRVDDVIFFSVLQETKNKFKMSVVWTYFKTNTGDLRQQIACFVLKINLFLI